MTVITKQEKLLIVNALPQAELEVVGAASTIFSRVFQIPCVTMRLKSSFSSTAIYQAVRKLEDKGIFFIHKENNGRLIIRFTEKGRSICGLVKEKMQTVNHADVMQTSLF